MRYNKKSILFDENGIARPVKYWADYHSALHSIIENQNFDKITFEMDGNYLCTIDSRNLKIQKKKMFRSDGTGYWFTTSEFKTGGHVIEFLSFFTDYTEDWLTCPDITFQKISE